MYEFPHLREAHDAFWTALAGRLRSAGVGDVPRQLTRDEADSRDLTNPRGGAYSDSWADPRLLLGQGCEYPLAKRFGNRIKLVATPRYSAPGCAGALYRSAIVVRGQEPAETLAELRNRRCVVNEPDSNSGMNLLRAALAPLSAGTCFFESVVSSGSHQHSVEMVAEGGADVAAVDCVTFAHLRKACPAAVAKVRILGWTPSSPCLPFITARTTRDSTVEALRSCLEAVLSDAALAWVRELLLLDGVDVAPDVHFTAVLNLQREAIDLGYPTLC
jgi:ABC-type phosphate/phosphonate transport system substrate-binding protein